MVFSHIKYKHLYLLQIILVGLLIVGCSRDRFCNFNLSDSDVIIYRELSAKYFADSLVAERTTVQDLCKYEE